MIKLQKIDEPQILKDNASTWEAELKSHSAKSPQHKIIEKKYNHRQIREKLKIETRNKCAYCESIVTANSYLHIEHIFPKKGRPDRVFKWDNLTFSCSVCNTNKGTEEVDANTFVHPYNDDPRSAFRFKGPLIVSRGTGPASEVMIKNIDLNRAELVARRAKVTVEIESIFRQSLSIQISARRTYINLSIKSFIRECAEYSALANDFFVSLLEDYEKEGLI